jgi:hypothetical protein
MSACKERIVANCKGINGAIHHPEIDFLPVAAVVMRIEHAVVAASGKN